MFQSKKHGQRVLALSAVGLMVLTACTAPSPKVLGIFFDGIPTRSSPAPSATAATAATAIKSAEPDPRVVALYLAARSAPPGVRHQPYANRTCVACHESQFSQKLRGEVVAICGSCHSAYTAAQSFPHRPVAEGQCLTCHLPHESSESGLLVATAQKLCVQCHDPQKLAATKVHAGVMGGDCQECHDPHGSAVQHLLRPEGGKRTKSAPRAEGLL
jgi:predicted CXXCH cytochrome family protein